MSSAAIRIFSPEPNQPNPTTVGEVVSLFLDEKKLRLRSGAYSEGRFAKMDFYLQSFCKDYGSKPIEACKNTDLIKWLLAHEEWASPHTKNDAIGAVVGCFRWAEGDHIDRSPYKRPKGLWPTPQPREAIEPAEFRAILDLARLCNGKRGRRRSPSCGAFRKALWFLWETGCRTCEMRELEWDFIDWDRGVVVLKKHKTDRSGEERLIPLSDRALRLLAWMKRRCAGAKWVFPNGRGKRPWTRRTFGRMFRRYADMAGVRKEVSAYCLRHGFVVDALEHDLGERQIADVIGQAGTKYVSWYGKGTRQKTDYLRNIVGRVHGERKKSRGGE